MKNKVCLVFGILLLTAGGMWAQTPKDIPLTMMPNDTIILPKSPVSSPAPLVSLNGTVLTFDYSSATASQVVIMDENNNYQIVYSESYSTTLQVIVDLEDEGIGEGRYLLWLYAFGQWWEGEFTLEEASNE